MKNMDIEHYFVTEDPVMEDCLLELPPFGSFPMRGFRKKFRDDLLLDSAQRESKTASSNLPASAIKNIAA